LAWAACMFDVEESGSANDNDNIIANGLHSRLARSTADGPFFP
jgi:hypothetical protein